MSKCSKIISQMDDSSSRRSGLKNLQMISGIASRSFLPIGRLQGGKTRGKMDDTVSSSWPGNRHLR